jgi:hypothetical protein
MMFAVIFQVLPGLNRAIAVALVAMCSLWACADAADGEMPSCIGAKCDDPGGVSALHLSAVLDCDRAHDGAVEQAGNSVADLVAAETSYRQCLIGANDSVVGVIEDNLTQGTAPPRSAEEIATVLDEFRYASLCTDIESASPAIGDELALLVGHCESSRERNLAVLIDALVDFTGQRIQVVFGEERESFPGCYDAYDRELAAGGTPLELFQAREALVECSADALRAHAETIKDAQCELNGCDDELLTLSFVQAGFETALTTSDRACQMFVDASVYRESAAPEHALDCRLAAYASLQAAVSTGLAQ